MQREKTVYEDHLTTLDEGAATRPESHRNRFIRPAGFIDA
jgi:hypothetical protein